MQTRRRAWSRCSPVVKLWFLHLPTNRLISPAGGRSPCRSVIAFQELPATHYPRQAQWLTLDLNQKLPHVASGETALSASITPSVPDDPEQQQCHPPRRTRSRPGLLLVAATTPTALCTPGRPMDTHKRTSRTALKITRKLPKSCSLGVLVCDSERTASRVRNMHRLLQGSTSMPLPCIQRIVHLA